MSDFWDHLVSGLSRKSSMNVRVSSGGNSMDPFSSVLGLTDKGRQMNAVPLSLPAGTRVAFRGRNLGVILTYRDLPAEDVLGTVITVRTAAGNTTRVDNHLFVKWDDGKMFPVSHEHLRVVSTEISPTVSRKASLGDLGDFFRVGSGDELVHKATKDLWSVKADADGGYTIERLFDESGDPLRV